MSSKLTVAQLREALKQRDLDTKGLKAELVARLDEALEQEAEEEKQVEPPKKRSRKGRETAAKEEEDDIASEKKKLRVDEIKKMTVAQLRNELDGRGLATAGRKPELVERLSEAAGDVEADGKDADEDEKDEKKAASAKAEKEEKKDAKLVKKGRGVLDEHIPADFKSRYHVLDTDGEVYSGMLNFSSVANNNNKFYSLQVLEADDKSRHCVFFRWGRVGERGRQNLEEMSKENAIRHFETKFREKTGLSWSDRHEPARKNKYTVLELDYEGDAEETGSSAKEDTKGKGKAKKELTKKESTESKLDKRLQQFISLICNIDMMKDQMVEIGYDARKMPLGKLSKATILKGYEVLKRIEAAIEASAHHAAFQELSSEFYTVIPHDFGRSNMRDKIIRTTAQLRQKMAMVEALGEIEIAKQIFANDDDDYEDPAYAHYKRLKCGLEPVDSRCEEYAWIHRYLKNTHGQTHRSYDLVIEQIFKVERDEEADSFSKFASSPNRMLLWHGSRLTNWTGILSQGLRIAPPEAPVSGYMFGKGVYFADMVSKSANYCCTSPRDSTGVLLLCEVALGRMNELYNADYSADKYIRGDKLSTKGLGRTVPNESEFMTLPDGVVVPMGKPKSMPCNASLEYNEYIVYNTQQIRMRYVLQVRFNYKLGGYY